MASTAKGPVLTVDAVIEDHENRIMLIKRGVKPFKGLWCLPGGKVDANERVEAALEREVIEEVGVRVGIRELIGIYSDPARDPRGHYVTAVFHATVLGGEPITTKEASDIHWLAPGEEMEMGFDHATIVKDWWERTKGAGRRAPHLTIPREQERPMVKRHPADRIVAQVKDEKIEGKRLVEDEAGRGKRAVKTGGGAGARDKEERTTAVRMRGDGAKKAAAASRTMAKSTTRKG